MVQLRSVTTSSLNITCGDALRVRKLSFFFQLISQELKKEKKKKKKEKNGKGQSVVLEVAATSYLIRNARHARQNNAAGLWYHLRAKLAKINL